MNDLILSASHVCKRFATHTALDDVSIDVQRGHIFGLLGHNGAGKTTLIRIINHITAPDSGTVTFDGHPLTQNDVARIGYLPEERGLYKKMKVGEQAVYLAQLKGLSAREAKSRLQAWFEKLDIADWWNKRLEELSKGMQQKVQFITTVVHRPHSLIFDEPFSDLVPINADLLKREILELRDAGHTVIFSTHNMESVEELCDDIALISHSRVVLSGEVSDVRRRFRNNTYSLTAAGEVLHPVDRLFEITEAGTSDAEGHRTYLLRKSPDDTNAELLRHLATQVEPIAPTSPPPQPPTMNKILLIIRREFLTRVRKTSFIVLTLLMPFLFVGIIATPVLLSRIGNNETARNIALIDPTGRYAAAFKPDPRFALTVDYKAAYSPFEAVVEIRGDLSRHPDALSISGAKEVQPDLIDYVENNLDEAVRQEKLQHYNIPQLNVIVSDMQRNVKAHTKKWDANGRDTTSSTALARAIGLLTTMLIYIFVMSYGMMVLQGVLEEKTNRIMEIMVSSVRPFQLMMGKIIGIALVGITQLAIWGTLITLLLTVGSVVFGFSADGGATATHAAAAGAQLQGTTPALPEDITQALTAALNLPLLEILICFVLYFIGSYLLFASFLAAVGSAVNSQEDSTQFTLPVTLLLIFGMYASIGSSSNTDGPLAFWTSLFPLTSPMVMMVRIPFGVPLWQELLSLTLLYASAFGMTWLAGKIYRVGILMYGKKPTVREILKWVRYR